MGSLAAPQHDITPMAASGGKAVLRLTIFDSEILNVCFSRKEPFKSRQTLCFRLPLTARCGRQFCVISD